MKQTAVEWLIDQLVTGNEVTLKGENYKLFDQAKEMEKEQIVESFSLGIISHHDAFKNQNKWNNGEEYYNETYGK